MENLIKSHVSSLSCLQHNFLCAILPAFGCIVTIILHFVLETYTYRLESVYGEMTNTTNNCMSKSIHPRNVYLGDRHCMSVRVCVVYCSSGEISHQGIRVWGAYKMFYYFLYSFIHPTLEWCWRQFSSIYVSCTQHMVCVGI